MNNFLNDILIYTKKNIEQVIFILLGLLVSCYVVYVGMAFIFEAGKQDKVSQVCTKLDETAKKTLPLLRPLKKVRIS